MASKRKHGVGGGQKTKSSKPPKEQLRWKPMAIECTEGLSSEDFAGLVGLEELDVDYKTFTGGKIISEKRVDFDDDDDDDGQEPEVETFEKVAKKKKKNKNNKKQKTTTNQHKNVANNLVSISESTVDFNESPEVPPPNNDPSWAVENLNSGSWYF